MLRWRFRGMTTNQKLRLDRIVGTPLAWATNVAARVLGKLLRRNHSTAPDHVRRIVVQKILGMGSIIQATPLLASLRDAFPNAEIVVLTAARNRALIERLPLVDRALYVADEGPLDLGRSAAQVIVSLLQRRCDLFFDLELYSAAASVLTAVSCARNRYGFFRHSAQFKKGSYTHLVKFATNKPVSRLYLQLGLAAGAREVSTDAVGPITVTAEDRRRLAETLRTNELTLAGDYIVINPNASDLMLERRWPANNFLALIEGLAREGRQCVLIGAPNEAEYVAALLARLSGDARRHTLDTSGRLTLGELFALIDGAQCVVTNDTGPMHFAFALHRPTVCLFGPVDPVHYGFESARVETLYTPVFCSPCVHENEQPPCAGNNICMKLIETGDVLNAVHRLLGVPAAPRRTPERRYVDLEGRALGIIAQVSLPSSAPAEPEAPSQSDAPRRASRP